MAAITTRQTAGTGATVAGVPLTSAQVDNNFINLNREIYVDNYPVVDPTLSFDFINTTTLDQRITFTRASTATYFNAFGNLTTAQVNVPRFDYDPSTGVPSGLLVEEPRTNSIRNSTMIGAVAGTPGTLPTNWQNVVMPGLSSTIVGTGTLNGITYLDVRINGTPSVSSYFNLIPDILVAGISGQTWTGSFWAALVGGSLSNTNANIEIREADAVQTFLTNSLTTLSLTSSLVRYSQTRTLNNASTAYVSARFVWQVTNTLPVDFTLRIGLPQLEQGAFATSVIPTTTIALARAADVASVNTLNPWYNAAEGTVVSQFSPSASGYVAYNRVWQLGNPGNYITYAAEGTSTGRFYVYSEVSSVQQVFGYSPANAVAANSANKQALAYKLNDYAWSHNGGTVGTDTSATVPTVSALYIANQGGTGQISGWIKRLTYYPRRLSNTELQAITA